MKSFFNKTLRVSITLVILSFFLTISCDKEDTEDTPPFLDDILTEESSVTDSSVTIRGEINAKVNSAGIVWNTSVNPTTYYYDGKITIEDIPGDFEVTITGLQHTTRYFARAYAINNEETLYSNQVSFSTLNAVPKVTTVDVFDITNSVAMSGGVVEDDGGAEITERGIVWSTEEKPTIDDNMAHTFLSADNEFSSFIDGLSPETVYYVRAYAQNSTGTGYGEQKSFETIPDYSPGFTGEPCPDIPYFTDERDGNVYNTVQIGNQCWIREDLRYLPEVYPRHEGAEQYYIIHEDPPPFYYVYGYDGYDVSEAKETDHYKNYGVLYDWNAAMDACPAGWHLPSHEEWVELERAVCNALGKTDCDSIFPYDMSTASSGWRGTHEANLLKSCRQRYSPLGEECETSGEHPFWSVSAYYANVATDDFGFSALPGGIRGNNNFHNLTGEGHWWTSSISRRIASYHGKISRFSNEKSLGMSVRCIRSTD